MSDTHRIVGVHITDRVKKAADVQGLLTKYGCNIKTRLGLHQVQGEYCSPHGLIVLELFGEDALCDELRNGLSAVEGVEVQEMVFHHRR
jgi:hypothetical protein